MPYKRLAESPVLTLPATTAVVTGVAPVVTNAPTEPAVAVVNTATADTSSTQADIPENGQPNDAFAVNGMPLCVRSSAPEGKMCNTQGYCVSSNAGLNKNNFGWVLDMSAMGDQENRAKGMLCDNKAKCMPSQALEVFYRNGVTESDCPYLSISTSRCNDSGACIKTMTQDQVNSLSACSLRVNSQKGWCLDKNGGLKATPEERAKIPCL